MNDINKIILLISLVSFNLFFAQVGIGTTTLDPSALLELKSNTSGVLIPRMIQDEKNAIDDPATGLLIYQTDVFPGFYYYDGVWKLLTNNQESIKGVNTSVVLNGTNLEVTDGKSTITTDLSSLKELPTPTAIGAMIYWDGSAWVEVAPTVNDRATLKMIGGVPTWDGGTPPLPAIGDLIHGGIVFWIDPIDPHKGMVCSLDDIGLATGTAIWTLPAHQSVSVTGVGATSLTDGAANTDAIITQTGAAAANTYAAGLCRLYSTSGNNDLGQWYLPAKDELNLMYLNIGRGNANGLGDIGNFSFTKYWSSTEMSPNYNYVEDQNFFYGTQDYGSKANASNVRAVRAF